MGPEFLTIGECRDKQAAKKLLRAIKRGRHYVNGREVFDMSKRKGRKLAYRWRGNRRGRRIQEWLVRNAPPGLIVEAPSIVKLK